MLDTHVFTVLPGEVVFRRSGNGVRRFKRCRMVTTRVISVEYLDGGRVFVEISVLVSGYERLLMPVWFSDWLDADCMRRGDDGDMQGGKPVTIAIGEEEFEEMLATGERISTEIVLPDPPSREAPPFASPVVAVLIKGRWVEPLQSL